MRTHESCKEQKIRTQRARFGALLRNATALLLMIAVTLLALAVSTQAGHVPGYGGKRGVETITANLYISGGIGRIVTLDPSDPDYLTKLVTAARLAFFLTNGLAERGFEVIGPARILCEEDDWRRLDLDAREILRRQFIWKYSEPTTEEPTFFTIATSCNAWRNCGASCNCPMPTPSCCWNARGATTGLPRFRPSPPLWRRAKPCWARRARCLAAPTR